MTDGDNGMLPRFDLERLYELIPAFYRVRDHAEGEPLRQLMEVLAEQIAVLEEDIHQYYDDQFIETAAEWAVPYIGDLIGATTLHDRLPDSAFSERAQVANTIAYRRRKGTAAILEQLARDVTNWDARVVEFFQILVTSAHANHLRSDGLPTPDVRQWEPLARLDTPFDRIAHTADVRRLSRGRPAHNIPNVGLFLWRLRAYPLWNNPQPARTDDHRYHFNPLGIDTPLYNLPEPEETIAGLAQPINVPEPLSRRLLDDQFEAYYGAGRSLEVVMDGTPVPPVEIVVCDLSDRGDDTWGALPADRYAIDPVLGRLALPTDDAPPADLRVRYHTGFSADMGGGEYNREDSMQGKADQTLSADENDVQAALDAVAAGGIVQVVDSGTYSWAGPAAISAEEGAQITLQAADGARPLITLDGELTISGEADSGVTLDGLVIAGGALRVTGEIASLTLRHCTLVPGIALAADGTPDQPGAPSLIVESPGTVVEIDRCITGALRIEEGAEAIIQNSIVDAQEMANPAYAAPGDVLGGPLTIENSTVRGAVATRLIEKATNTIFLAAPPGVGRSPVLAERRQQGCVRFSYVPRGSQVPQRYNCQPTDDESAGQVRPQFTSMRYGDAGYFQLSPHTPDAIRRGADDEAEMGAFHDLYQPQRETNLRVRLDEFLRVGLEAGIFYAS
jgi:hypothetical protein